MAVKTEVFAAIYVFIVLLYPFLFRKSVSETSEQLRAFKNNNLQNRLLLNNSFCKALSRCKQERERVQLRAIVPAE